MSLSNVPAPSFQWERGDVLEKEAEPCGVQLYNADPASIFQALIPKTTVLFLFFFFLQSTSEETEKSQLVAILPSVYPLSVVSH